MTHGVDYASVLPCSPSRPMRGCPMWLRAEALSTWEVWLRAESETDVEITGMVGVRVLPRAAPAEHRSCGIAAVLANG